jgi:hypothetical protein
MSCNLLGRPANMWGALLVFTPPCMDFMLSCTAGIQKSAAGRVKRPQKSSKTLQGHKKATETGKIATGRQKRLQESEKTYKKSIKMLHDLSFSIIAELIVRIVILPEKKNESKH